MKSRALTILSLSFGLFLFSRAYAVSSEIVDTNENGNVLQQDAHAEMIDGKPASESDTHNPTHTKDTSDQQCLTGSIHKVIIADMKRLQTRTAELEQREAALSELESSLKVQLAGIEAANETLDNKINGLKTVAGDDLKHLVGMYQTMKPKQAAEIFNSMDPAFAAGFLREMNSNTAGLIMANMDARKSYSISVIIASKNAKYR